MPLEEFLFPNERIEYSTLPEIEYAGDGGFQFFVTNQRVILFATRGMLFKRDHIISRAITEISEIAYKEKGLIKMGHLIIRSEKGNLEFKGKPDVVKEITKLLQNKLETVKSKERPLQSVQVNVQSPTLQKEVVTKEVVMLPCEYCQGLMPQTAVFCPNCGAQKRK